MADTAERRPRAESGVPDGHGGGNVQATVTPAGQVLTSYVSLYLPSGRRRWYWYAYRCGDCSMYQLGRAPTISHVPGPRRAGCGHWVNVTIARVYGGRP